MATEDIAAHFAIQSLKAQYFRFVDGKDWQRLRALFTKDATLFFPAVQQAPLGVDDTLSWIADGIGHGVSIHHGHMPEIEILSSTRARGVWAMEDRVFWPADEPSVLGLRSLHGFGHYHEEYRFVDGRWLISALKLVRIHEVAVPTGGNAPSWAL